MRTGNRRRDRRLVSRADFVDTQHVLAIEREPEDELLARLVGAPSRRGLRQLVRRLHPDLGQLNPRLLSLLDEVPIVTSLSRHALIQRDVISLRPPAPGHLRPTGVRGGTMSRPALDLCSGWARDGAMAKRVDAGGSPVMSGGLPAPCLDRRDDVDAWHAMPALPPDGFRRRRRIDVSAPRRDGIVTVDGMFRDTYVDPSGKEIAIHEYSVGASVDSDLGIVVACEATRASCPPASVPPRPRASGGSSV